MNKYNVIIVGAGVGGLICGSLLSKAGLRVLILEKNSQVGGYCSTFKVKGFRFDSFVHSFGNLSQSSHLNILLSNIGVMDQLKIVRINPSDIIITPDYRVEFGESLDKTVNNFVTRFPEEQDAIKLFFYDLICLEKFDSIKEFRSITFRNLLDKIFNNEVLKQILSLVILGNLGTTAREICCFTAIKHYRQFIVDGGYYTLGGVDAIPIVLANNFRDMGGEIILLKPVTKIVINNCGVRGVETKDGSFFCSDIVVSDCDMRTTLFDLVGKLRLNEVNISYLESMIPSLSLIVTYLGLKNNSVSLSDKVNNWFISDYQYDKEIKLSDDYHFENFDWFMVRCNHEEKTCVIYANAPTKDYLFWKNNRSRIAELIVNKVDQSIPGLKKNIIFRTIADPSVLNRWTSNYSGAAYGWASTLNQFMVHDYLRDRIIPNLFFCGHWSTVAQGVPGVAIVAQRVSEIIKRRFVEKVF